VYAGDDQYFDCGGAFYSSADAGFQVVQPPVGATVDSLPQGAEQKVVNGTTYYLFGAAYYQPFYSGSSVIYQVVPDPTA
jgi:hypothetical protein